MTAEAPVSDARGGHEVRPRSVGQAFIGLAILGWGVSILLEVAPHEDRIVGVAMTLFGLAVAALAPRWPTISRLPPILVAGLGIGMVLWVVGFNAYTKSGFAVQEIALGILGLGLAMAAPVLERTIRTPWGAHKSIRVATLVGCGVPVLGTPLFIWGMQATFKGVVGRTPIEAFIETGLLIPLRTFLTIVGWEPLQNGQQITYMTQNGFLTVDVGAACSGIQAMGLFTAVLALMLFTERPGGRFLAIWSLIGVAGVYVANVLRLVFLTVVGHLWGSEALLQAHAQAGWIFFVAWAVGFSFLLRHYRKHAHVRPA
jgi:exosortase/archaeosortase family protein